MATITECKILGRYLKILRRERDMTVGAIAGYIHAHYPVRAESTIYSYVNEMEIGSGYMRAALQKTEPHATILGLYMQALKLHPSEKQEIIRLVNVPNFNFEVDERSLYTDVKQVRLPSLGKHLD